MLVEPYNSEHKTNELIRHIWHIWHIWQNRFTKPDVSYCFKGQIRFESNASKQKVMQIIKR